jgi:hypothetical protein
MEAGENNFSVASVSQDGFQHNIEVQVQVKGMVQLISSVLKKSLNNSRSKRNKVACLQLHCPLDFNVEADVLVKFLQSSFQGREWLMVFEIFVIKARLDVVFALFAFFKMIHLQHQVL